jgi:hypothetical protein
MPAPLPSLPAPWGPGPLTSMKGRRILKIRSHRYIHWYGWLLALAPSKCNKTTTSTMCFLHTHVCMHQEATASSTFLRPSIKTHSPPLLTTTPAPNADSPPPPPRAPPSLPVLVVSQVPVLRAGLECAVHGISHCINRPGVHTDRTRQAGRTPHKLCRGGTAGSSTAHHVSRNV